ncbi:hypothetical protein [Actinoallomurus iriomotensis]|uniref:hypothetical protein n=1 Tax=Actinoallomurus iriomotensis TaxID=478107 RepID=UPI002554A6A6|nr:hypothetical protein [Actinoallomurus iriomotensis]
MIQLDGDGAWEGTVSLVKRLMAGQSRVDLEPIGLSITHKPTEKLIHDLKGAGAGAPAYATLSGFPWEVLPPQSKDELTGLWIDEPGAARRAADTVAAAVKAHVLPWMRSNADLSVLARRFQEPQKISHLDVQRLERAAVINYELGDGDAAAAALAEYADEKCGTGISAIDDERRHFVRALTELIG